MKLQILPGYPDRVVVLNFDTNTIINVYEAVGVKGLVSQSTNRVLRALTFTRSERLNAFVQDLVEYAPEFFKDNDYRYHLSAPITFDGVKFYHSQCIEIIYQEL